MKATVLIVVGVLGLLALTGIVEAIATIPWIGFAAVLLIISTILGVMVGNVLRLLGDDL